MGNNNKYSAVTTFNLEKHSYGIEMINSFFLNWPDEIQLTAYIENSLTIDNSIVKKKIIVKEYHDEIPEYLEFCKKYSQKKKYVDDFRFDVFRFAHKVFAILASLKYIKTRYLIWLDSDIKTHTKIPLDFFDCLVNETTYMSYLGREKIAIDHLTYSECGFLIFDTHHAIHKKFWEGMMDMYKGGKLFNEKEWHDSYIFDQVRKKLEKEYNFKNFNICDLGLVDIETKNDEHVFVTSVLGKYMDHKKGDRKNAKWSPELIKRVKKNRSRST